MTGDNKFSINIRIDGRNYPLRINREEEEKYRLAAKYVNETVAKYREVFHDMESTDFLAMTAFQIALNCTEKQKVDNGNFLMDELKDINDDISDFLKLKEKK
ncbi:MAG: cell division protein ZapA [Draconibacterium sp.]|nr:MAG: cell division protein ZapA [Draconibacterium sp.]PIF06014.1 MAG: cell division protein ZapA [Draconibacterium sp.]